MYILTTKTLRVYTFLILVNFGWLHHIIMSIYARVYYIIIWGTARDVWLLYIIRMYTIIQCIITS